MLGFRIILPVIASQLVDALTNSETTASSSSNGNVSGSEDLSSESSLSSFAFLYGTIPTAPALIFFANQYALDFDLVATGLVICTFISVPIIFLSAHMISLKEINKNDLEKQLETSFLYVSAIGIAAILWMFTMFLLAKRYRRFLHKLDIILLSFLFIACMSMVTLPATDDYCPNDTRVIVQFWFQNVGVYGSHVMITALAVALVLVYQSGPQIWYKTFLVLATVGIIVPIVLTSFLVGLGTIDTLGHSSCGSNASTINVTTAAETVGFSHTGAGRFIYGDGQLILSTILLFICVIICCCCLLKLAKLYHQKQKKQRSSQPDIEITSFSSNQETTNEATTSKTGIQDANVGRSPLVLRKKGSQVACVPTFPKATDIQSDEDRAEKESFALIEMSIDEENTMANQQTTRHLLLILYSLLSMIVSIFLLIWRLVRQSTSAVFYELEFLDGVLNYGQGFILFALFGFDKYPVFSALQRRWRRYFFKVETVFVPQSGQLDSETQGICAAFKDAHMESCKKEIVTDRRYHLRSYKQVFSGCQMVAWLIDSHIVNDSGEAVEYGRALLRGRIIRHVKEEHDFHDIHYFYQFIEDTVPS